MTSHKIQTDLTRSYAEEITEVIKEEIGDSLFSVLIDESHDISVTEQMAVLVRLVLIYLCIICVYALMF